MTNTTFSSSSFSSRRRSSSSSIAMISSSSSFFLFVCCLLSSNSSNNNVIVNGQQDTFNYYEEDQGDNDYGTKRWHKVSCNDVGNFPDVWPGCPGWPDKYLAAPDWRPGDADVDDQASHTLNDGNWCMDCSDASNSNKCPMTDSHTQGPIRMKREHGIPNHPNEVECIDSHWMKYFDGSCTWEDYVDNDNGSVYGRNNFLIRNHALQIMQPLKLKNNEEYILACLNPIQNLPPQYITDGSGLDEPKRLFPKLDYSKGFPEFWHLDHISIKMPSEFWQEDKQYDATIYYEHHYSVPYQEQLEQVHKVTKKKLGNVVINLQAYRKAAPDPFLDKVICQFRKTEDEMRKACGLSSISQDYAYPGCWNYEDTTRNLKEDNSTMKMPPPPHKKPSSSSSDSNDDDTSSNLRAANSKKKMKKPVIDIDKISHSKEDFDAPPQEAFDAFIEEQIKMGAWGDQDTSHITDKRKLLNYDHVPWHIYGFLINCRTEYYHRLQASHTVPPCQHNHWRIMKDPLRVAHRQIRELARLLSMRVDPDTCVEGNPTGRDRSNSNGPRADGEDAPFGLDFNRPLQETTDKHKMKFCECKDWDSHWPEDKAWCEMDVEERFYDHPYNFFTNGKW